MSKIKNMPGHVAVTTKDGKVHWAYHDEWFRKPTENEL